MATQSIQVILIDETQKAWVLNQNKIDTYQAPICDHGQGEDICASVLTLPGYEAWATYFAGATVSNIEISSPF